MEENSTRSFENDMREDLMAYVTETFCFPCEWENSDDVPHRFRTDTAKER